VDSARWEHVQAIFHDAIDRAVADREAYVLAACGHDAALLADVLALLHEDAHASSLLDRGLPAAAAGLIDLAGSARRIDRTVGPYRLISLLGEGGMGTVYLAERDDLGSRVAIKFLRGALSPARAARFAAEQRTLAQLNHAAIAHIYDADVLPDGTPWFAMEYVAGEPLSDFCRARVSSVSDRLRLFRSVCEAVHDAHRHLIVHRDLKPSNILVTHDGRVKLLDFGIAKQLYDEIDGAADVTITSLRQLTPAYAAPEQLRGGRIGLYTDVYALGVILYELLANCRPYDLSGRTPAEVEAIIAEREPTRPSLVNGRLPASASTWADLDVLCLTAMHKDPQRRYPTVEALARDLDHFLNREPLEARPEGLRYRAGKFLLRRWRPLTAAAAIAAFVAGLTIVYTVRVSAARRAAEAESVRTSRIQRFMLNLFEGGDEATGPSEDLRVSALIDRGVQEARALDNEPAVQAELFRTLGGLYQKLGKFDLADGLLRAARDQYRTLMGASADDVGESLVALGRLRVQQAQFDEAERLILQGLDILRAHGAERASAARATAALGEVLEARGAYDRAIAVNVEAVRLYGRLGEGSPEWTAALGQLADSHYYAGHYDEADRVNQRVLGNMRRIYGDRHPSVADVLINLGASQFDRGRYHEAEGFYRQALDIMRTFYGADHFRTASATTMLGRCLLYEKQFQQAVDLLERALAVQERVNGPIHPRVASALNDLGLAALQGQRYDEAEARFRRMIDIYRAVYGADHNLIATATSNLGGVNMGRGDFAQAERFYRDALAMFERTQSSTHLNAGIAHIKIGRALLRQGRYAEAELESRAGYDIVRKQASPSISFLAAARTDLVAEYDALHQADKAAAIRLEIGTAPQTP
jgi:eukaryotic-like serine/threonine-protein kinase